MSRFFVSATLTAAILSAWTSESQAVYITTNGDLAVGSVVPAATPRLTDVWKISGAGGQGYANTYTDVGVNGEPLDVGDLVRSVTAENLASLQNGGSYFLPNNGDVIGDSTIDLLVAFAVTEAGVDSFGGGGGPILDITSGRLFLAFVDGSSGFDADNPSTWTANTIFAEYTLGPRAEVIDGEVAGFFPAAGTQAGPGFLASEINNQTPNAGPLSQAQQRLVFLEDSTLGQNASDTPGATSPPVTFGPTGGDNFLANVDPTNIPGLTKNGEGFVVDIATTVTPGGGTSLDATDLGVLNSFAALAGYGDLGGAGTAFSTAGAGQPTDYLPFSTGTFNGDVIAVYNSDSYMINSAVPEPTSTALVGMFLAAGGFAGWRKRRAQAAA